MPTFLDFHSLGRFTEDDLKRAQNEPRDEYGVERHHSKFGIEGGWITQVKAIADYDR